MKKKIIIGIIIVAVIAGIIGISRTNKSKGKFTSVKAASVTKGDIKAYFSTTATIKSKNSKDYYAPDQAKVLTVNVKVGDKVNAGEVLVTYQVADLSAAVKQAQISLANANSQKQELLNSTQGQATVDTEKLNQADNAISLAQISLDSANANLAKSVNENVADFAGVVTSLNAKVGGTGSGSVSSTSGGSTAAVTIEDQSNLEAEVNLDKYSASEVKVGEAVTLSFANNSYTGKVSYVAPTAVTSTSSTTSSTTLTADIDINKPQTGLIEGFDSDVNILTGESDKVLSIPAESIKTDKSGKNYVFVISNNKAVEKEVQLGIQSDTDAEVKSGLNVGDKVILNPSTSIINGTSVKAN